MYSCWARSVSADWSSAAGKGGIVGWGWGCAGIVGMGASCADVGAGAGAGAGAVVGSA